MSIVVYYLRQSEPETGAETGAATGPQTAPETGAPAHAETHWLPHCLAYTDQQMSEALAQRQRLRADAPTGTAPGLGGKVGHDQRRRGGIGQALGDGFGHRVVALPGQADGQ